MQMHFRVQSVLLSNDRSALTLSPVEWSRGVGEPDAEGVYEEWESADPMSEGAEPFEPGGKMTEIRVEGATEWKPGDFLTLTLVSTDHAWSAA